MIEGEDGDVYCEVANLKGEDGGFQTCERIGESSVCNDLKTRVLF